MRILFAATPAAGHLNPILSLANIAMARGDEALIATGSHLRTTVEASGASFAPLLGAADLDLRRLDHVFPQRTTMPPGPEQLRFDIERVFIDTIPAQAETLRAQIQTFKPDIIVAESAFIGRAPLFYGDGARPPIVGLGITFLALPRLDGAPIGLGLPPARNDDDRARYAVMAHQVDTMLLHPTHEYLSGTMRNLGVNATVPDFFSSMIVANELYLQPSVPSFEYDPGRLPVDVRYIGALPPPLLHREQPEWWHRLDGTRPIVLVTQGTVANSNFDDLVNPALAALADRGDLHVVVATGGRAPDEVAVPDCEHIFVAPFVDYTELIPRLSLLVTNGGYGTVSLALSAGVPIVAVGRSEDKAEVGARIEWSGVGLQVAEVPPDVRILRGAIDRALSDQAFRDRAMAMAAEFRGIDTPHVVMAAVDDLVRAKSDSARP